MSGPRRRSRALVDAPSRETSGLPPPRRARRFHVVAALGVGVASLAAYALFRSITATLPARGHTTLGLALGVLGTATFLGIAAYSLRKRAGQEWMRGRLDVWLRVHAWLSFLGLVLVVLHAGIHWDGGTGTLALVLLAGTLVSGVGGFVVYRLVPGAVAAGPRNLASGATKDAIADVDDRIALEQTGRSAGLRARVAAFEDPSASREVGLLPPGEDEVLARIVRLREERAALVARAADQRRLRRALRMWLWAHIPLAALFVGAVGVHAFDATDATFLLRDPRPDDFAAPESCLPCHRTQFEEWIRSPHAIAQSSPVMELQNRLVVLKDRRDVARGGTAIAGDVCVRCHGPTGYVVAPEHAEDLLAPAVERAPASRFGVSCVTCHQIDEMHANRPDPNGLEFRNMENFTWKAGRTMVGAFGRPGETPSVGNSSHRARHGDHMGKPEMCASCHTVVVANPAADSPTGTVTLQNTYIEWRDGGDPLNWSKDGLGCMDCHNRPLGAISDELSELARTRAPLADRLRVVRTRLAANPLPVDDSFAAEPRDGFDRPLEPGRRRYLHTFAGVDERMTDVIPFHAGHPRQGENASIRKAALANTTALMRIAAGVRVAEWPKGDEVLVEVGNLGTGHNLPAGFAFARELWLEVSAGLSATGPFTVLTGGDGRGGEIVTGTRLDKSKSNLRNFQAVLFDSRSKRETVLQNEATGVLKGAAAVKAGFVDRENFLKPGEVRRIPVRLEAAGLPPGTTHLRVRLRFRSLAPEFIAGPATATHSGGLSARFREIGEIDNATRAEDLLKELVVLTIAEDLLAR